MLSSKALMKIAMQPLSLLDKPYVAGVIKLVLLMYAGAVAPTMPKIIGKMMKNPAVKLLFLFLIVYTGLKDKIMALMIAVAFVVSMMALSKLESINSFKGLLNAGVDVPQEFANGIVDGAQALVPDVALARPVQGAVDGVQKMVNDVIDNVQSAVLGPQVSPMSAAAAVQGPQEIRESVVAAHEDVSGYEPEATGALL